MIFVDIYNDATYDHIASFEIEFDWQYDQIVSFEDALTEKGIKYFEITTYQQGDQHEQRARTKITKKPL